MLEWAMKEKTRFGGADGYRNNRNELRFPLVEMGEKLKRITIDFFCLPAKLSENIVRRKK